MIQAREITTNKKEREIDLPRDKEKMVRRNTWEELQLSLAFFE